MLDRLKFSKDDDKPIEKVMPPKQDVPVEARKIVTPQKIYQIQLKFQSQR